jgi:hypothetical protein
MLKNNFLSYTETSIENASLFYDLNGDDGEDTDDH